MENTTSKIPEQPSDVLLALDNEKKKIQAVKGFSKTGSLQSIAPNKRNQNQFLRIDKSGDPFSNFFSNFMSQLKNPSNFIFFKVPSIMAIDLAIEMQKHINQPSLEGEKLLKQYEVKTEQPENKNTMETKQKPTENKAYRFNPEMIDWDNMNNLGLGKERLEKLNILEPLLHGYKTNDLVSININLEGATIKTDARLSLQLGEDAKVVPFIHGIRKEPNLNYEFFGHKFSDEDKKNLLETGNMGRVVNLSNSKTGESIPSIVSVDRLTNELVALKTEFMKVPDEIKGVKLNDSQKQTLMEGKSLPLEAMISKKGTEFSATVQFNADKRYVEFLFDRSNSNQQVQNHQQNQTKTQDPLPEVPKTFRGKELDNEQYSKFKAGQTVYVDGLIDKKGQAYQGYITLNQETGKTRFSFQNPNKIKEQAKPTEAHKTQTAVNSEGKTNEATKHTKEALKPGQQSPKTTKQQEQQEQAKTPTKSRSRKM